MFREKQILLWEHLRHQTLYFLKLKKEIANYNNTMKYFHISFVDAMTRA